MQLEDFELSAEDLIDFNLEAEIAGLEEQETHSLSSFFFNEQKRFPSGSVEWKVFGLFGSITQFGLNHENFGDPFIPMFVFEDKRGILPKDFSEKQLLVLNQFLPGLKNAALKARIADVLWTMKYGEKPYQFAEQAIESYITVTEKLLRSKEEQIFALENLRRGFAIARSINSKNIPSFLQKIEGWLSIEGLETNVYSRLVDFLLIQDHLPEETHLKNIQDTLSKNLETEEYWRAEQDCNLLIHWFSVAKNDELKKDYLIEKARVYTLMAEQNAASDNYIAAVLFMKDAINLYRTIDGFEDLVTELRLKMIEYQAGVKYDMKTFSESIDISNIREHVVSAIKGKSKRDAILLLATFGIGESKSMVEKVAIERQSSLMSLIGHEVIDSKGRTTAKRASSTDPDQRAKTLEDDMFLLNNIYRDIYVSSQILPGLHQLTLEHNVREEDLEFIIQANPLIPRDRRKLFQKGLIAGFKFDFITATHILVFQLENSLRVLLNDNGIVTTGLNHEGIEEEFDLNRLLEMKELESILGEDFIFQLKGLLTNRFGVNLRNRVAHGLFSSDEFLSYASIYLWWLVLKFCSIPYLQRLMNENKEEKQ